MTNTNDSNADTAMSSSHYTNTLQLIFARFSGQLGSVADSDAILEMAVRETDRLLLGLEG